MTLPDIPISDYTYDLPDEQIARFPLAERDQSKLLVYQQGSITHSRFDKIGDFLPQQCLLVFNNTKVIPARLLFQKATGAVIEVFLLHPVAPTSVINMAMEVTDSCVWECMIGNKKRWKSSEVLDLALTESGITLQAELIDTEKSLVRFSWKGGVPFVEIVKAAGQIPLPPYLKRMATEADVQTYQTVYSQKNGAVAAPTAGLHFTSRILQQLTNQGIDQEFLTLHVGAGTFQPVKVQNAVEHTMHSEQVVFSKSNIIQLLAKVQHIVAVGTTSMRALESLYWMGVREIRSRESEVGGRKQDTAQPEANEGKTEMGSFFVEKLFPYQHDSNALPSPKEALEAILALMQVQNLTEIVGETEIMILPGYQFKLCKGLITNYHQPGSTLMLLVAALVGNDWKRIYAEALQNNYRFLSYGDSSLLVP